jgi:hypothetical protein
VGAIENENPFTSDHASAPCRGIHPQSNPACLPPPPPKACPLPAAPTVSSPPRDYTSLFLRELEMGEDSGGTTIALVVLCP